MVNQKAIMDKLAVKSSHGTIDTLRQLIDQIDKIIATGLNGELAHSTKVNLEQMLQIEKDSIYNRKKEKPCSHTSN